MAARRELRCVAFEMNTDRSRTVVIAAANGELERLYNRKPADRFECVRVSPRRGTVPQNFSRAFALSSFVDSPGLLRFHAPYRRKGESDEDFWKIDTRPVHQRVCRIRRAGRWLQELHETQQGLLETGK